MKISLKSLYKKYSLPIGITFTLLSMESLLLILIPFGIGQSIDSLNQQNYDGIYLLGSILMGVLILSTLRRFYDTRVYTKIYSLLCFRLIKSHKKDLVSTSAIVTRSHLSKELVDFFEHDLTQAFTSLVGILGALFMIGYFNIYVFYVAMSCVILMLIVYKISEPKIYLYNQQLNTELENRLHVIQSHPANVFAHLRKISRAWVRLSDLESINYIFIQLFIASSILSALFISIEVKLSTGNIFALMTYVLNFSFEILTLPIIFEQFIRLKEITHRLNKGTQ